MTKTDTKDRLLDAAEAAFADAGFDGASLRAITSAAGVNLAAANYHFGSKEELYLAVWRRRIEPVNAERLARLAALESAEEAPGLEDVARAFLEPALRGVSGWGPSGRQFLRLSGRLFSQPGERADDVMVLFREVLERFVAALVRALPGSDVQQALWGVHFMAGVLVHHLSTADRVAGWTQGVCRGDDDDEVLERLVQFVSGGLRAMNAAPRVAR